MKKVEASIEIKTTPANIIRAFTDINMLRIWWGVERALIETRSGGVYTLAWNISDKGFGYISSGTIRRYQPENLLELENFVYLNPERSILGPMSLIVKATRKEGNTELYLRQDGYQEGADWDWYYEAVREAWPTVLLRLKEYLEKNK